MVITYMIDINETGGRAVPGDAGESSYRALIIPSVDALVGGKIWGNDEPYPDDWPGSEGQFDGGDGFPVPAGSTLSVQLEPAEELWIKTVSGSGNARVLLVNCDTPRTADDMNFD